MDRKKDISLLPAERTSPRPLLKTSSSSVPIFRTPWSSGRENSWRPDLIDETTSPICPGQRIPYTTFEDLTQNQEILKLIDQEVVKITKTLSQVESIKKFALLPGVLRGRRRCDPTKKVKEGFGKTLCRVD
jgi:long-chain acyl-CoA synthetase